VVLTKPHQHCHPDRVRLTEQKPWSAGALACALIIELQRSRRNKQSSVPPDMPSRAGAHESGLSILDVQARELLRCSEGLPESSIAKTMGTRSFGPTSRTENEIEPVLRSDF
jgi:hypothetical protein